jgi:hypothetical protein
VLSWRLFDVPGYSVGRLSIGTSVTVGVCQGRLFTTIVMFGGWSLGSASR